MKGKTKTKRAPAKKRTPRKVPRGALGSGMAEGVAERIRRRRRYLRDLWANEVERLEAEPVQYLKWSRIDAPGSCEPGCLEVTVDTTAVAGRYPELEELYPTRLCTRD